jgi:hypothetical protein
MPEQWKYIPEGSNLHVGFEISTTVAMKSSIFFDKGKGIPVTGHGGSHIF